MVVGRAAGGMDMHIDVLGRGPDGYELAVQLVFQDARRSRRRRRWHRTAAVMFAGCATRVPHQRQARAQQHSAGHQLAWGLAVRVRFPNSYVRGVQALAGCSRQVVEA